jgi:glycosyltransferase involved in cell wall biosynthesis
VLFNVFLVMSSISLVMVVKDEEERLPFSLGRIAELIEEVIVIDTGSHDSTIKLALSYPNVKLVEYKSDPGDPTNIVAARNYGISLATQDWILLLDADELIEPESLRHIKDLASATKAAGMFFPWINNRQGTPFVDYKLFCFRNNLGIKVLGLAHAVPQHCMRALRLVAIHVPEVNVIHWQDLRKKHRCTYIEQMIRGIDLDPTWVRYYWFLGYDCFEKGDLVQAQTWLRKVAFSKAELFPVEVLNALVVLGCILKYLGETSELEKLLTEFDRFYLSVERDFEVLINTHYVVWRNEVVLDVPSVALKSYAPHPPLFAY